MADELLRGEDFEGFSLDEELTALNSDFDLVSSVKVGSDPLNPSNQVGRASNPSSAGQSATFLLSKEPDELRLSVDGYIYIEDPGPDPVANMVATTPAYLSFDPGFGIYLPLVQFQVTVQENFTAPGQTTGLSLLALDLDVFSYTLIDNIFSLEDINNNWYSYEIDIDFTETTLEILEARVKDASGAVVWSTELGITASDPSYEYSWDFKVTEQGVFHDVKSWYTTVADNAGIYRRGSDTPGTEPLIERFTGGAPSEAVTTENTILTSADGLIFSDEESITGNSAASPLPPEDAYSRGLVSLDSFSGDFTILTDVNASIKLTPPTLSSIVHTTLISFLGVDTGWGIPIAIAGYVAVGPDAGFDYSDPGIYFFSQNPATFEQSLHFIASPEQINGKWLRYEFDISKDETDFVAVEGRVLDGTTLLYKSTEVIFDQPTSLGAWSWGFETSRAGDWADFSHLVTLFNDGFEIRWDYSPDPDPDPEPDPDPYVTGLKTLTPEGLWNPVKTASNKIPKIYKPSD